MTRGSTENYTFLTGLYTYLEKEMQVDIYPAKKIKANQ